MSKEYLKMIWEKLPPDWIAVEDQTVLLKELKREMSWIHKLRWKKMIVFAMADYGDDIAVLLADNRIVEVHLTWQREFGRHWPHASLPMSLEEWLLSREEDRKFREKA